MEVSNNIGKLNHNIMLRDNLATMTHATMAAPRIDSMFSNKGLRVESVVDSEGGSLNERATEV